MMRAQSTASEHSTRGADARLVNPNPCSPPSPPPCLPPRAAQQHPHQPHATPAAPRQHPDSPPLTLKCASRICRRPSTSGAGTMTWRSKRPGRTSALSRISGKLVAATTMTPSLGCCGFVWWRWGVGGSGGGVDSSVDASVTRGCDGKRVVMRGWCGCDDRVGGCVALGDNASCHLLALHQINQRDGCSDSRWREALSPKPTQPQPNHALPTRRAHQRPTAQHSTAQAASNTGRLTKNILENEICLFYLEAVELHQQLVEGHAHVHLVLGVAVATC